MQVHASSREAERRFSAESNFRCLNNNNNSAVYCFFIVLRFDVVNGRYFMAAVSVIAFRRVIQIDYTHKGVRPLSRGINQGMRHRTVDQMVIVIWPASTTRYV